MLHFPQEIQPTCVRQLHVKKDNINGLRIDQPKRPVSGLAHVGAIPESGCRFPAGFADEAVVFDDQQVK
jgi:hypothetical protein